MSDFLAIDTSSRYLTVVAKRGDKVALTHLPECAMQHSVILMGEIGRTLKKVNLTPSGCDFFAVVTGPGSFTGIRIGVATAKGLALAADKPLKGVTAFDLLAYNVNSASFYTVIDAAHSHFYVCGYTGGKVNTKPCYLSKEEVEKLPAPLYGFEDLPLNNYTKIDIKNCLQAAAERAEISKEVHALYVRKSQAEENLSGNKRVEV